VHQEFQFSKMPDHLGDDMRKVRGDEDEKEEKEFKSKRFGLIILNTI